MEIHYRVIRSDRKTIAIQIKPDGEVFVRCNKRLPERLVREFVESKENWIEKQLARRETAGPAFSDVELRALAEKAKQVISQKVAHFAPLVGVSYGRITIRSQRSRWGSCSGKGNLNFNCLLMLAPAQVVDYVVVHELCHRKEMNHSPRFWAEVESVFPEYRTAKQWLKENGTGLIARLR